MHRWRNIIIALVAVLLLGGLVLWGLLGSDAFWNWGGRQLVEQARERIHGELKVGGVQGHPLTGFTFTDLTVTSPQGEVLHAPRLELRFSLWSFVKMQPVIAELALHEPRLTLRQDAAGLWEAADLLKKRPPPPFSSLTFPHIVINRGEVILQRPDGVQRYGDLDLNLDLTVLHPQRPHQEVRATVSTLAAATPLGRFDLTTRLTYRGQRLEVHSLELQTSGRRLAGLEGEVGLGEGEPPGQVSLQLGPVPGEALRRFWPQWPGDWDVDGKLALTFQGLSRCRINGEGHLYNTAVAFQGLLHRQDGQWRYDLDLNSKGLDSKLLAPFHPVWAKKYQDLSPLEVRLQGTGTGLCRWPAQLDWRLTASPCRYGGVRVEHLSLALTGNGKEQRLQGLIRGNFGQLSLLAAGPLLTAPKGELTVRAEDFQPRLLGLEGAGDTLLTGKFTGSFSLPDLKVAGEVEAKGRWGQQPLEELAGRLTWEKGKLEVPQARIRMGALAAELKGSLRGNQMDWQWRGTLAPGGARPFLPFTVRGRLDLAGTLTGTLQAPQFSLQAGGQGLSWEGLALNSFTLKAAGAGWPPASGDLEFQGTGLKTPVAEFSHAKLSCRGEAQRWRLSFTAATRQGSQAELRGVADLGARPLSLSLERCAFRSPGLSIHNLRPVQLRLLPGLEVEPAAFRLNDGELSLRVQAQGAKLAGTLEVRDLAANLLARDGPGLQGKIGGHLTLSGEPGLPVMQGKLTWGPGKIGEFPFQSLQATCNYREATLFLSGSVEEKAAGPRLIWDGRVPVHLSVIPFKWSLGDRDLFIRVRGENANLSMLTALGPEVQAAEGPLDILAEWRGNPRDPQVSGQIRWGPGSLRLHVAGPNFRLLPGQATLQGSKITIPDLTLESGGTMRINGAITLAGFFPKQVEVRAQVQDFLTLQRQGSQATATGNLTVSGPWSALKLKGHVVVPKAQFATGLFQSDSHPDIILVNQPPPRPVAKGAAANLQFWKNLDFQVILESAGDVWVKNKSINIEMVGRVKAFKPPGQEKVQVAGTLRPVKGNIEMQGKLFKVTQGLLNIPATPGQPVTVEGQAIHEMDDITLVLNVSGPANKPLLRLSSIPPLPAPDLLGYLVFSRPAARLSREEYTSVNQQALGILGGITAKKLQEILGADFPLVGDVTLKSGQQTVGVTKPLTKDLSVSFERKTNPILREDTNQVRLEYKVNRYLSVESTMGRRNTGGDVLLNYDF